MFLHIHHTHLAITPIRHQHTGLLQQQHVCDTVIMCLMGCDEMGVCSGGRGLGGGEGPAEEEDETCGCHHHGDINMT